MKLVAICLLVIATTTLEAAGANKPKENLQPGGRNSPRDGRLLNRQLRVNLYFRHLVELYIQLEEHFSLEISFEVNTIRYPETFVVEGQPYQQINFSRITVRALFNEIVRLYPMYKWYERNGRIFLFLKENPGGLLNIKVAKQTIPHVTPYFIGDALCRIEEVQRISEKKVLGCNFSLTHPGPAGEIAFDLTVEPGTLRQVLERILGNRGSWLVGETPDRITVNVRRR